ncbi:prolyl oligopeptidase family serine peptidase [Flavobacterium sp. RHBU_3]|uniref:prolyl oligopeptidase family serine peptidase n=1 Tax=Flavobacterium sp. RHBU_3 TaxID=3391184 RepID=UPI00398525E8
MKKLLLLALLPVVCFGQKYPVTKKTTKTTTKFGTTLTDDYTWLNDMHGTEVAAWVNEQNKFTQNHLSAVNKEVYPLPTLQKYEAQTNFRIPTKKRDGYYANIIDPEEHGATPYLGYKKKLDGLYVKLVDPNYIYSGKTVNVIDFEPSVHSKMLAYKLMVNGSDNHEIRFVSLSGKKSNEIIPNAKFGGIAWKGDEGIFYSRNANRSQFAADSTFQVMYHKLGTDVLKDEEVFNAASFAGQVYYFTSHDGTRLFLETAARDEQTVDFYYADLTKDKLELKPFLKNVPPDFDVSGYVRGRIYYSSKESNWGDVRSFDPDKPEEKTVIIPQYQNSLLVGATFFENRILCRYKNSDGTYFMLFDYSGKFINRIQVQKGMDVVLTDSDYYDKDVFFYVTSYTIPPILFTLNLNSGNHDRYVSSTFEKTTAPYPVDYFETKTSFYTARDGVKVPITLVYKKGLELDGNNPTLLKAYGGFGVVNTPHYDNGLIYFLNNGGVYAYAEVRGGGERGEQWHNDGRRLKKINTLNDFIDAARFLIDQGYTNSSKLAITGASQGGLLVGAALVQHPELFKVAVPKVGVYDMANFHSYTIGRFHFDEYGNPDNEAEFKAMMQYSPYNNIKEGVNYPVTLILTSDNDDRVPPVHSYKFAAKLQNHKGQTNPVYLKTLLNSGHYGITTGLPDRMEEQSDFYAFILYHLTH